MSTETVDDQGKPLHSIVERLLGSVALTAFNSAAEHSLGLALPAVGQA